ncbi:MAG: uroporphyrinogen-III C-methyltransferase [Phycisphaerae bacterium]
MPDVGIVYLVGAGPGDPGLLTLKGKDCLARADVVVHDYLACEELLNFTEKACERIYVGKQAGEHVMEQDEINALLVTRAKEGKIVVRLKGGDPYVFGRGGEEALELLRAGVPVEVVPGVTSGVAAPAYAGIPVTHREFNSVLTLVTGHEDPTKTQSEINWNALASGGGTLVFYMGVRNLPHISQKLIQAGRSPQTPIALIRWGTLPIQQVVEGTLDNIVERVNHAGFKPPCIIVVGEVVRLRQSLNWFENRPLFGKTILITRSREQASEFAEKLSVLGARVLQFHSIQFAPAADDEPLRSCVNNLNKYDWIIFTSVNAVDKFFDMLQAQSHDSRSLAGCKICSIGPATSNRLKPYGIVSDLMPKHFTSEEIFNILSERNEVEGKRFLLPRADIAGRELPEKLRTAGAVVDDVETYRTIPGSLSPQVKEALESGEVDIVTFTSSSTARNFASIVRQELGRLPDNLAYVSIGPETSKAAREENMNIQIEAPEHTIEGLVSVILNEFGAKSR